jgi:exocyst complex component 1
MHGITERYLSGQKADAAGFVRKLLDDLESRISAQFSRVSAPRGYSTTIENIVVFFPPPVYDLFLSFQFIDEACHQIERNERNVRLTGIVGYIPRYLYLMNQLYDLFMQYSHCFMINLKTEGVCPCEHDRVSSQ